MIDLAIIPARGGSKRILNKNIKMFCGKPLIEWTVDAVEKSESVKDYVISTDIPKILEKYSKAVKRPEELCGDEVYMSSVIKELLTHYPRSVETIAIMQVTSPLRIAQDIDEAARLYDDQNANWTVVSVEPLTVPKRMYNEHEEPLDFQTEHRSQEEPEIYWARNSAIFIFSRTYFEATNRFLTDKQTLYKMPKSRSIDINEPEDWMMAEALMKARLGQ